MGTDIKTYDMNAKAKFGADMIFEEQALPNATNASSSVFQFGSVQGAIGLMIVAVGDIDIAASATLKIELLYDESETGSFANSITLMDFTGASNSSVQVSEALADEILSGTDEVISQSKTYTNSEATSAVVGSTKTFTFVGQDWSKFLSAGDKIVFAETTSNNGEKTIASIDYNVTTALATVIVITETATDETFNGTDETMTITAFDINGDATSYIEKDSSLIVWKAQDISDFVTPAGTITLANTEDNDGSYTVVSILTGDVKYDGEEMVNYIPSEVVKQFCKLKITTTTDLSAFDISAYKFPVPR